MTIRRSFPVAACAAAVALAACGGSKKRPVGYASTDGDRQDRSNGSVPQGRPSIPKPPSSHTIASVPERTLGPFAARRGAAGVAVYVAPFAGGQKVVSVALAAAGNIKSPPKVIASTTETSSIIVRPTGGDRAGFVAAWTTLTDRGEALRVMGIGDDGAARGEAVEIAHADDDIVWTEIVPTPRGAVVFWAEETKSGDANVLGVALDPDGKARGVPSIVAKGVVGWQAVPTTMGAGLALVASAPSKAATASFGAASSGAAGASAPGGAKGALSFLRVDADVRPIGAPQVVSDKSKVGLDFDVSRLGAGGFAFAWTDRTGLDPQLMLATISPEGTVRAPARAAESPVGGATFVAIAGGSDGALIAWEEQHDRGVPTRYVHFAQVDAATGAPKPTSTALELQGNEAPELVTSGRGYAVLGQARACLVTDAAERCAASHPVPVFVRLDETIAPVQVEALRFRELQAAGLAWGLDCEGGDCHVLAASSASPPIVHLFELAARTTTYRVPLAPPPQPDVPRVVASPSVTAGEAIAELAVAQLGDASLLATLGAPPDDKAPGGKLTIRALDDAGKPRGAPNVLTTRALPMGGVAIAGAEKPDDGAVVAWVSRDAGDPQVHAARVDKAGKKIGEVILTNDKGDAADVAVARAAGGWTVAWVDGRDGNGEVYATHLAPDLHKLSAQERITSALGDASEVALAASSDAVWIAWCDPRESPHDGFADVYAARLDAKTSRREGDEIRVLATAAHSRSPALAAVSDGVAVGWIEEAPMGADSAKSAAYGAMIGWLDATGRPSREPVRTQGAGAGFPTAIALDAPGGALRGVIARSTGDVLFADALRFAGQAPPRATPLLTLDGPPSLDVSLKLTNDVLYYNEYSSAAGADGEHRVRRAKLGWK